MNAPLKIRVWDYSHATPPKKELIVESATHWIASFNWDEGQGNPYTPTEKEARDNAQLFIAAQAMKEALEEMVVFLEWCASCFPVDTTDELEKVKKALNLANGKETP